MSLWNYSRIFWKFLRKVNVLLGLLSQTTKEEGLTIRVLSFQRCENNLRLETCAVSGAWRMPYFSLVCSPIVCKSVNEPSYVPVLHFGYKLIFKKEKRGGSKSVK